MDSKDITEPTGSDAAEEEASVTMVDVLEREKEMEAEYAAVLGASDEKSCTYILGPVSRQALYSCLTCCPEARDDVEKCAGICLACSYKCHENHELIELYTKRNFRCDCPTERFGEQHRCALNPTLDGLQPRNAENLYNQNFQGVYCNCHRPYPDPEATIHEVMLQCAVCEDWFHLQHMDVPPAAAKLVDTCTETICDGCMKKHTFLRDYTGLSLKALEDADESQANITVGRDTSILCEENDNKLRSDLDKSISEIMGEGAVTTDDKANTEDKDEPEKKRAKVEAEESNKDDTPSISQSVEEPKSQCTRPTAKANDYEKGATFWGNDWRTALCQCATCMDMYKTQKVEFLLDPEDSAKSYEERGMQRVAAESSTYEQGIKAFASIGHVQQIDAITEYNHMKDKLKEYLQTFAVSNKVVTEEDINRFFELMRSEKNTQKGQPYYCH